MSNQSRSPSEAEQSYLEWWTSIETDVRKSMLVWAHRDTARLHELVKMAFEAGRAARATPAEAGERTLPELPQPSDEHLKMLVAIYSADDMIAYGQQCARYAVEEYKRTHTDKGD